MKGKPEQKCKKDRSYYLTNIGSGRKITEILKKNPKQDPSSYDEDDLGHMRKVVSYCKRHLAQEEKAKQDTNSKSYKSLKNCTSIPSFFFPAYQSLSYETCGGNKRHPNQAMSHLESLALFLISCTGPRCAKVVIGRMSGMMAAIDRSSGPSTWHCGEIERVSTVSYGFLNASLYLDRFYLHQSCAVRVGIGPVLASQLQSIESEMYS